MPIITVSITKHAPRNAQGDCLVIYYFGTKRKPERVATSPAIPGHGSARQMVQILRFLVILEKKTLDFREINMQSNSLSQAIF